MKPKKAIVPLADGFEEIEAVTIIDVLRRAEVEVTTAALDEDSLDVEGAHGICVVADATLEDLNCSICGDFDAIVLPGGMRAMEAFKADERILALVKTCGLAAAVCASPVVLAAAGILKGRKATCHPSVRGRLEGVANLQTDARVVRDGNVITGSGPGTTMEFALAVAAALTDSATAKNIADKMQFHSKP